MQCTLTGPGVMSDGINKEKHSFEYRLKDAELASIVVNGPHGVAQKVHLDPDNCRGWYDASSAGQYIVSVTFTKVIELENVEPIVGGSALEGGLVEGPVSFEIDTGIPTGGHAKDIIIQVVDSDGNRVDIGALLDNDDGTYEGGQFYPVLKGRYRISVLIWGQEVAGSPFRPVFELASAERSFASGVGVEGGPRARRGVPLAFTIHSRAKSGDPLLEGGEPFQATVQGPNYEEECNIIDNDDGTYSVEYCPPEAGNYEVNITLHDRPLAPCPYKVGVTEGDASKERRIPKELRKAKPRSPSPGLPVIGQPAFRTGDHPRSLSPTPSRSSSEPPGPIVQYRASHSRSRSPARPPPPPGTPPRALPPSITPPRRAHPSSTPSPRRRAPPGRSPGRRSPAAARRSPPPRQWARPHPRRGSRTPPRRPRSQSPRHIPNQLWVGGLPHDYTSADMQHLFGRFGKLTNIDLRTGWAFLTYTDHQDAEEAQRTLHRQSYEGRVLQVEFRMEKGAQKGGRDLRNKKGGKGRPEAPPPGYEPPPVSSNLDEHQRHQFNGHPKNWRIIVEGTGRACGWQELKDWARDCGLNPAFTVVVDGGVGVVDFATRREFGQAMRMLPRKALDGREVRVVPARWQPAPSSRSPSRGRKRSRSDSRGRGGGRRGPDFEEGRKGGKGKGGKGKEPRMPLAELRRTGRPPPPGYVCHQCHEAGHWREHCKLANPPKRPRRSASRSPGRRQGSPRSPTPPRARSRSSASHHSPRPAGSRSPRSRSPAAPNHTDAAERSAANGEAAAAEGEAPPAE